MKENEPREGEEVYEQLDMETYCLKHFGMFDGEEKRVQLRFTNNLLDTVIERFGTDRNVFYIPDDKGHFIVNVDVAISNQFYGWICSFRKMAKIISPPEVVEDFHKFLDDIYGRYKSE